MRIAHELDDFGVNPQIAENFTNLYWYNGFFIPKNSMLRVASAGLQVNDLPDRYYLFPIQNDILDRNKSLEQNNNWGGPFNPAPE